MLTEAGDGIGVETMKSGLIRFGSLAARLSFPDERYGRDVAHIFGTHLQTPEMELDTGIGAHITFSEGPSGPTGPGDRAQVRPPIPADGMVLKHHTVRPEIHTEALSVFLCLEAPPARIQIDVLRPDMPHFDLCVHLAVVFHKMLFFLDRVVLHAAAIQFEDRVSLFLGDKGAGKSTIALKLARSGGTVLGEDHLILHRSKGHFLISGCDERSRLTRKTEEYFFDEPLNAEPMDFAGTLKKEVPAGHLFQSVPFTDHPVDCLFFSRVGKTMTLNSLPGRLTLLELMKATGKLQRFVDPADRTRFLDFLADFTPTVAAYGLELSEDLGDLDQLVEFLRRPA